MRSDVARAGDMVKVWIAYTDGMDWEEAKSLPLVTPLDVDGADRYVLPDDKVLHLVSAYLKRRLVGEWTVAESGKPKAEGVCFNLSHTTGAVAIALSDREIGVDIERIRSVDEELIDYVCAPAEREEVHSDADFFRIWTAKESLIKAHGKGFDRHPDVIPALPIEGVREYLGAPYRCRQTAWEGWVLSVSVTGDAPFDWEIQEIPLPTQRV